MASAQPTKINFAKTFGDLYKRKKFSIGSSRWWLLGALITSVLIGVVLALFSWSSTAHSIDLDNFEFCLSSSCVKTAEKEFSGAIYILQITGAMTAWFAAVGGIVIALFSYISSSRVSAFGNHVSHISIFSNYMVYEISKRGRIAAGSVDIYGLYTLMFSGSRGGSMDVSKSYIEAWGNVAGVIRESNRAFKAADGKKFSLRLHQSRLKKALDGVGIRCELMHHRIDFLEVEGQIFDLIDSINVVFCADHGVPRLPVREYM